MNSLNPKPGIDSEQLRALLIQSLPPVSADSEPARDLWPLVLQRLHTPSLASHWFDWALLGALIALAAIFPASIPVFLYYL